MLSLRAWSIVALLVMIAAMVGLLVTHSLFSRAPVVIVVQSLGVCLMLWARATLGWRSLHAAADPTAGGIVTSGPYHFIRHPIYTAACFIGWAGVLSHWSIEAAVFGALLILGALGRIACEERLLTQVYPDYREYAKVTKRMIPFAF